MPWANTSWQNCRQHKIDIRHLGTTPKAPTSYTDVMTEQGHGRRTFFHARGANALWRGDDLDFKKINARIFHLGYLLLLDALDEPDAKYGTKAARLLAAAQAAGIKTSVDVVSEDSDRFAQDRQPGPEARGLLHPQRDRGRQDHWVQDPARRTAGWTPWRCGMPPARCSSKACASWW